MSRKKNGLILTNHSHKRAQQRAGITKNQLDVMANRAWNYGITHAEAKDELKSWMDAEYLRYKTANNCRFYANKMYLFHNQVLITVLDAPLYYEQQLKKYVIDIKTYIKYKRNRIKNKRNANDLCKDIFRDVIDDIAKDVSHYLNHSMVNKDAVRYTYSHINYGGFQVVIKYTNMTKTDKEVYKPQINQYIKDKFGLDVAYKKQPDLSDLFKE